MAEESEQLNGEAKNSRSFYPPYYRRSPGLAEYVKEGEIDYPFEDTTGVSGDENKIRGNWSSKVDFLLSSFGFTVGLGNLWRFPHYCYLYGGAAFLIPYLVLLLLVGFPMVFMELSLGQFASLGCLTVWKVCPFFKGIGVAMFAVSCVVAVYYNLVTAWSVAYLVDSFRTEVPWASCGNFWNSPNCSSWSRQSFERCTTANGTFFANGTCSFSPAASGNESTSLMENGVLLSPAEKGRTLPSHEFFHDRVLAVSAGIDEVGTINWQLALYLLGAWLIVFFCLFKGVKSSGKVVYLTAVAPYVILLILLVRALYLPGSFDGLKYFLQPKWEVLTEPKVWGEAAVQVFFSLSVCWGGLATLSSYNRFHNNCFAFLLKLGRNFSLPGGHCIAPAPIHVMFYYKFSDAWLIVLMDAFSSLFAGFVTFATIGYMAYELALPIDQVPVKGPGLAFVAYAEAIAQLPIATFWAILFFSMLIMLAIDTQFFVIETVVTAICDEFPSRLRRSHRHVMSFVCALFYMCGVPLCTQAGIYMMQLIECFVVNWSLLMIGTFECIVISWVYGIDNLLDNIKWMIRFYPVPYVVWKWLYKLLTPVVLLAALISVLFYYEPLFYEPKSYKYPKFANQSGWALSVLCILAIPLTAVWKFCWASGSVRQRLQDLLNPESDWGPALAAHRAEFYPLQVPEGRVPLAPPGPPPMETRERTIVVDGEEEEEEDERRAEVNEVDVALPKFDRETAI